MHAQRIYWIERPFWAMAKADDGDSTQSAEPGSVAEERQLIAQAQGGDQDAFEQLLRRHQRRVFSLIGHLLRRPADVEDIAQQVFLKVYLALPRFDFRSAFSTWLYRIAVNECYDQLRRQRARKSFWGTEVPLEELAGREENAVSATGPRPADLAAQAAIRQLVEKLFRRLAPQDSLVLTLKELEGFSVREIAELMQLRENTVKVRLFRARRRFLRAYERAVRPRER